MTYAEKQEEFQKAVRPLIEYIQKNYHPHVTVVVNYDSAEICEGIMAANFEVPD